MATRKIISQPSANPKFAARVWNWKAKKFLYARDYGLKGFPIG